MVRSLTFLTRSLSYAAITHRIHDRTVAETRFVCVGSSDGSDGAKVPRRVLLNTDLRKDRLMVG